MSLGVLLWFHAVISLFLNVIWIQSYTPKRVLAQKRAERASGKLSNPRHPHVWIDATGTEFKDPTAVGQCPERNDCFKVPKCPQKLFLASPLRPSLIYRL